MDRGEVGCNSGYEFATIVFPPPTVKTRLTRLAATLRYRATELWTAIDEEKRTHVDEGASRYQAFVREEGDHVPAPAELDAKRSMTHVARIAAAVRSRDAEVAVYKFETASFRCTRFCAE